MLPTTETVPASPDDDIAQLREQVGKPAHGADLGGASLMLR